MPMKHMPDKIIYTVVHCQHYLAASLIPLPGSESLYSPVPECGPEEN